MKRLLVLSGKGGTGKTTVSAALVRLANAKAFADCDVDAPNLHLVTRQKTNPEILDFLGGDKASIDANKCIGCGLCKEKCRFGAIEMVNQKAVVNEYACEGCGVCAFICPVNAPFLETDIAGRRELYIDDTVFSTATLKMGRGNSGKLVSEVKLAMIKSAPECELSIVDGSPGIGCPVIASVGGMDVVLIVAEPSESGISDLKRLVETITSFSVFVLVCVNKYDTNIEKTKEIESYCSEKDLDFIGKIPYDEEAVKAVNLGYTIVDVECKAGDAVKEIYKQIKHYINEKGE